MAPLPLVLAAAFMATAAHAQAPDPARPYAGLERRVVASLSEAETADLRAGRGMGLALPAELNGHPGPMHALEHADALGLDASQRTAIAEQFARMRAEAQALGARVIEAERSLDGAFAARGLDPARLSRLTAEVGALRGELRAAHLRAHLETAATLRPEQIARYAELRGYGPRGPAAPHDPSRHHGASSHGTPSHGGAHAPAARP